MEIPKGGDTFLVVDLVDPALRDIPIGVRIVKGSHETEDETVTYLRPTYHPDGVIKGETSLDKGEYTVFIVGHVLAAVHIRPGHDAEPRARPARARAGCHRSRSAGCRSAPRASPPAFPSQRREGRGARDAWLLQEALVVAHHQLRLDLLHRLEGDADRDQHGRASERELVERPVSEHDRGDQRDGGQEQGPRKRDADEHVVQVVRRRRPGPDPRDEPALLADLVRGPDRIELDRRVEVREEHDQQREQRHVDQALLVVQRSSSRSPGTTRRGQRSPGASGNTGPTSRR